MVVSAYLLAALHLFAAPLFAQSVCGNALRESGEQCDDGNAINLDGCNVLCEFEQVHRTNSMAFSFVTDSMCTVNAFGQAFTSTAQGPMNQSLADSVTNGSVSIMYVMRELDDLSGTSDPSVQVGVINGAPFAGTGYNGNSDLDWWYTAAASSIDASRVPLTNLTGSFASKVLTTAPGTVSLTFPVMGTPATLTMSTFRSIANVGSSSAPIASAGFSPPGHIPSEHLDPALTSYQATSGGKACGNISAASLASMPIPPELAAGGAASCSRGYTLASSMLDVLVGGCTALGIIPLVNATQPDQSDPAQPVAGAGAPYQLVLDVTTKRVTQCRDKNAATVDLTTCLNAAAYSSAYTFTTDRVIVRTPMVVPALVPATLAVDPAGNSMLEPGETATVNPSWLNPPDSGPSYAVTSTSTSSSLTVVSPNADYGTIADGQTSSCTTCVVVTAPASRPSKHWDTQLTEAPLTTPAVAVDPKEWSVHVGNSFTDVPSTSLFYRFIESLLHYGVTGGCSLTDPLYCPSDFVLRDQMAAFIARSIAGSDAAVPSTGTVGMTPYDCSPTGTSLFSDVPAGGQFCRHVHYIAARNVTAGCGISGQFCPTDPTPRGQMAAFIARSLVAPEGDAGVPANYTSASTGRTYDCGDGLANAFSDVTDSHLFCKQIHFVWARGVLDGFPDGTYGPAQNVTRDQMSKFLANAFNLAVYRP